MKKLLIALICLLPLPAYAQTTKPALITEINTNLPDNATGAITPAIVRTTLTDMVNSWLDLNGTAAFNCGANTWISAFTNLSTPSCSQIAFSNLSGNIAIAQIGGGTGASNTTFLRGDNTWVTPAGGGTVTQYINSAGAGLTTSGSCNVISNNLGSPCQYALTAGRQTLPTTSVVTNSSHTGGFAANGSGTYTTPANVLWLEITMVGGGGGGGGGNNVAVASSGGATCWNTTGAACTTPVYSAGGGGGSTTTALGPGGTVTGSGACLFPFAGGSGTLGSFSQNSLGLSAYGGTGAVSTLGGSGSGAYAAAGSAAQANSGSGGGGGGTNSAAGFFAGGGGGAAATCRTIINTPAATYTYAVGTGGAGAAAGTNGFAGGLGAGGQIFITEHYGS